MLFSPYLPYSPAFLYTLLYIMGDAGEGGKVCKYELSCMYLVLELF